MWNVRLASHRGIANFGWLDSKHTFSFGDYWDPAHMGFGVLRVINEDRVTGGAGFPRHPHRDMEILSYVLSGALEHKDSMGNGSIIERGEIQYMSAGTGVTHSEYNALPDETAHFYQIWILPNVRGAAPRYAQRQVIDSERTNQFQRLAGGPRFEAPIELRQDASLASALLSQGTKLNQPLSTERQYWLQVARGQVEAVGSVPDARTVLHEGDGLAVANQEQLLLTGLSDAELLLFDLPTAEQPGH